MSLRQATKLAGLVASVSAAFPPESERPSWEQRDNCIQKADVKGCLDLDHARASDAYKACKAVSDQVDEFISEASRSDACHEMNMDMDYGSYTAKVKDSYYQCVSDAAKIAVKNKFYFEKEFTPLFVTCGKVQVAESLEIVQSAFPPQDKRPSWEQRDDCINKGQGKNWKSCISLDSTRSSAEYKACESVETEVDQMTADGGATDACHKMDVDIDYGSQQGKLGDSYYQCVAEMQTNAQKNEWYYKNEFTPLWITCGALSFKEVSATLV